MGTKRRSFLKEIGLMASLSGVQLLFPTRSVAADHNGQPASEVSTTDTVVITASGAVKGYLRNGIYTYKGIPYGATTAGENRFMPPLKPVPWDGIRNAITYGPISPQNPNSGWPMQEYAFLYQWIDGYQDEDCLRLNVWSPGIKDGKKRPVMFWIHGGGFTSGSSQEHPSYHGENLSRFGDVVVVSVNHRLNLFGFLDLSKYGAPYDTSANVGMLDLVAALEWVRDHISAFGGDPDNVTIFGQSGGGTKVITLMAMPAAEGLFHKAISESNSIVQVSVPEYAQKLAELFLSELKLDASNLADLNKISVHELIKAGNAAEQKMSPALKSMGRPGWQPVVDGKIIPDHPFDPVAPKRSAHLPFMVGSTRNEAAASIDNPDLESLDENGLKERIMKKYPVNGAALYQAMRKVHPDEKPVEILSFLSAQNPMAYLMANRKALQQGAPVYLYLFDWKTKVLDGRPGSFHCSELPFVFYNTAICDTFTGGTAEALALSGKMAKAWVNFARTGNPNHKGLPAWPAFTTNAGATMVFNNICRVIDDPDGDARKALEEVIYHKKG